MTTTITKQEPTRDKNILTIIKKIDMILTMNFFIRKNQMMLINMFINKISFNRDLRFLMKNK